MADAPCAELWMGAHPKAPSEVLLPDGPIGLDAFVARDPEAVLGAAAKRLEGRLPFLPKVLAADAPLSIQAHPNREQAKEASRGRAVQASRSTRATCYADTSHKPEFICALDTFHALNSHARRRPRAARGAGRARTRGRTGCAPRVARSHTRGSPPSSRRVAAVGRGAGVRARVVVLEPGQAMYLPAGELHSRGVAIEIMANFDNVLRGASPRSTWPRLSCPALLIAPGFPGDWS